MAPACLSPSNCIPSHNRTHPPVRNALAEAKERLDNFLAEAVEVGVELEFDAKAMRKTLRACDTPEDLRHAMLELEKVYCTAGEGLPPGAACAFVGWLGKGEGGGD